MPIKELKGFRRITLKKGEEQEITIKLRKDLLRYWDETQGKFLHPSGSNHSIFRLDTHVP
jgi:beta-glucosidase